jgi:phosphoglycerate dehydrogenase-like enzyme
MPDPVILMPPNRNLEPDVVAIGRQMLPPGFELRLVPADRLGDVLRDADYLMGFIGPLDDATLAGARRLRLVQLLSVGSDRFNLAGARPPACLSPSTAAPTPSRSPSTPSCS